MKRRERDTKAKQEAQRFLSPVPEEYVFWCQDGRVFRDMAELRDGLVDMTDETFAYHCNVEKKDFSNWVRDVIGDQRLAQDLEKARTRTQAAEYVATRIAFLKKKLA